MPEGPPLYFPAKRRIRAQRSSPQRPRPRQANVCPRIHSAAGQMMKSARIQSLARRIRASRPSAGRLADDRDRSLEHPASCALLDDSDTMVDWRHLPDDLVDDLQGAATIHGAIDDTVDLRAQSGRTVKQAVQASGGNLSEAARCLGISRNTLYRKLRQFESASGDWVCLERIACSAIALGQDAKRSAHGHGRNAPRGRGRAWASWKLTSDLLWIEWRGPVQARTASRADCRSRRRRG